MSQSWMHPGCNCWTSARRNSAFARTVMIPTLGVKTTEFDLSAERAEELYQSGVAAATDFFGRWDFADYKEKYRQQAEVRRRYTV